METIKKNWKRYLVSSIDTFVMGFSVAFFTNLEALTMTSDWQNMRVVLFSIMWGAIMAGIRSVIKMFRESLLSP